MYAVQPEIDVDACLPHGILRTRITAKLLMFQPSVQGGYGTEELVVTWFVRECGREVAMHLEWQEGRDKKTEGGENAREL